MITPTIQTRNKMLKTTANIPAVTTSKFPGKEAAAGAVIELIVNKTLDKRKQQRAKSTRTQFPGGLIEFPTHRLPRTWTHSQFKFEGSASCSEFRLCGNKMASVGSYDLLVTVDDVARVIRGVSVDTTCEDVVSVLSKASGKKEPQVLVEVWQGCARPVALSERPLLLLAQWGRHRKQVSLALRDAAVLCLGKKGGTARRGHAVRGCKALGRSGPCMQRFRRRHRRRVRSRLQVHRVRKGSSSPSGPSGAPLRAAAEKDSLCALLEERLQQLKGKQALLEEAKEKLQAARSRDTRPLDQKQGALSSIISRLEKELSLRSNLHQLQSTKIQEVQSEIASAEERIRSLATSLIALRIDSETEDVLVSGQ